MPEQMMCPMRSDSKTARYCEPDRCMWGRYYEMGGKSFWTCSATVDDRYYDNFVKTEIRGEDDD